MEQSGKERLCGKKILIGVSSSVAIYKCCELISLLKKAGAVLRVMETEAATRFLRPELLAALTQSPCRTGMFESGEACEIEHITWAQWADAIVLYPATAHLLARAAAGLADERLTATLLAARSPILAAPAMNSQMYLHPATQENLERLRSFGWGFVAPQEGTLACGDEGIGKLAEPETVLARVTELLCRPPAASAESPAAVSFGAAAARQESEARCTAAEELRRRGLSLRGKSVLVTAGPTREAIDPVRFISNRSSGKMGYACAAAAAAAGAEVTLISGPVTLDCPAGVKRQWVETAAEMKAAVDAAFSTCDWLIMTAAVADFRPAEVASQKKKKDGSGELLRLEATDDILSGLKERRRADQVMCGFAMETEDLLARGRVKRRKKGLDLICCNSLREEGAGFAGDTNRITMISESGEETLPLRSKKELAYDILDKMREIENNRTSLK